VVKGEANEVNGLKTFLTKLVENWSIELEIVDNPERLASMASFLDC